MGRLDGKVALVTGASSGIGEAIARGLAAEGATVALVARRADRLDQVAAAIGAAGGVALTIPADVTVEAEVERVFGTLIDRRGRLDVLVNNAGTAIRGPIDEMPIEDWDRVIAINLRAPFLCTRQALRIMKRQGGGRIINIGSISAQRVRPDNAPYNASKFGIDGLTHSTALEGRPYGVSCCNARYLFSHADVEYFKTIDPQKSPSAITYKDSVAPIAEAGLADLSGLHTVDEHLTLEPAPGHTPGTMFITLASHGARAVFCGDILHQAIQIFHPEWNSLGCADQVNARGSRRLVPREMCRIGRLAHADTLRCAVRLPRRRQGRHVRPAMGVAMDVGAGAVFPESPLGQAREGVFWPDPITRL
jgi:NAD(P)-dependent dehydrogenase (short-subunit alcohol dehydrogenase family)